MRAITVHKALTDPRLLGAALGDLASWQTWLTVLRAAFALPLSEDDEAAFRKVAGERKPPSRRVRELWAVVGRRSGKSRIAAALSVFLALFQKHKLASGEVGSVLVLAASKQQAEVVFGYVVGFIEASDVLRQEVEAVTADEVRLRNRVVIGVHAGSFRTVRGRTLLAVVADEVSFWKDESSALPDVETYRACLPSLMSTGGMWIGISTPYRRLGLLHQKHRDHFGQDGDDVLVVQGDSRTFNPTLDSALIESATAADPESALAEWAGEFRSDIAAFLDDKLIDDAVDHDRPLELPPRSGLKYVAFADPSGGRHDAFAVCIGHREGDRFVADAVRGRHPPFDPQAVVAEYAVLAKEYGCFEIIGDNYSAAWCETAFTAAGIKYVRSEKAKSALYLEALPLFTRSAISIPDHAKLLRELRLLERRTHRSGKDSVDHGRSGSDDYANAVVGCAVNTIAPRLTYDTTMSWVRDDKDAPLVWTLADRLHAYAQMHRRF